MSDSIVDIVRELKLRPLEEVYAVVSIDAIHLHVRCEGQIVKKAVYIANCINMDGLKEVLAMWVWKTKVQSMGFSTIIETVYPKSEIQQCIIRQIRNITKFVSYKDIKPLMVDLKKVYAAID